MAIFRGVPTFRPVYLRDYQTDLDALNNLRSWEDILSFKTNRKPVGLVVSEEKIVTRTCMRIPQTHDNMKKNRVLCIDTLWVKNFDKLALSFTVKEIQ